MRDELAEVKTYHENCDLYVGPGRIGGKFFVPLRSFIKAAALCSGDSANYEFHEVVPACMPLIIQLLNGYGKSSTQYGT